MRNKLLRKGIKIMMKENCKFTKIIVIAMMLLAVFASLLTTQVKAAEDILTRSDKVAFSGGGTCELFATLTYSFGNYVSTNKYYVKNPKSGYTMYTESITVDKQTDKKIIYVNGGCAQAKSQPDSSSYTDMQVKLPW